MSARALVLAALALAVVAAEHDISDEEFYEMPRLFHLDQYAECLARRGVYCVGSFELAPDHPHHKLYHLMQRYSANEVDHFNHTLLHRGLCVSRRCPRQREHEHQHDQEPLDAWFASCVNASTRAQYGLSARLTQLQYCERGGAADAGSQPLTPSEQAFAALVAALAALAALSTVLELTLSDHVKKSMPWALAWSVRACWRSLQAERAGSLAVLDGLRVLGMLCFIVEHVCWLNTTAYLADTRQIEKMRASLDGVLVTNSTLMVQAFFLMSSFLLADKLLRQRRRQQELKVCSTIVDTVVNRIVRMSPSYGVVVWFAASWWCRLGAGPLWAPLVGREAAVCRRKWPAHLLYLNNLLQPDDKCLIQTWYLAADMQLYLASLALTLCLWRARRAAGWLLAALLAAATAAQLALALRWRLVPTFVLHRPEAVRALYSGEASFNVLYQSPLGNLPGALAGLLLAHLHHAGLPLTDYRAFRWSAWAAPWAAAGWTAAAGSLGRGAALAAAERTVFALLVALALLGALNGVGSPVSRVLSWRGWAVPARLSFGALLLHMIINKTLLAARLVPAHIDRQAVVLEWFGVAVASYLAALPLALLVEIPVQRLHRALRPPAATPPREKRDDL